MWRDIRVLDFDSCSYHNFEDTDKSPDDVNEKFVNVIRRVLDFHDNSTLDKLNRKFCFSLEYTRKLLDGVEEKVEWEMCTSLEIEKLIRYAIIWKVKELDLDLNGDKIVDTWNHYRIPYVLRSDHLTYLKLTAFDMTSCKVMDLKSLRVIFLNELSLSDEIFKDGAMKENGFHFIIT